MTEQDIAIVGLAVEVPGAADPDAFWEVLAEGRSLTRPFPQRRRRDIEEFTRYLRESAIAGWGDTALGYHHGSFLDRIDAFEPELFEMTPRQAEAADPHQRLVLRTMFRALEDSGYVGDRLRGSRTGVFVGFAGNPGSAYLDYVTKIDPSLSQTGITGNIPTMLANRLSYLFDLHGPSMTVDSACSASLVAVHQARAALLLGDCDLAVVAGTRVVLFPIDHPFTRIGIESSDGVTRTFDDDADGTGYGEGSGVVVLKRLAAAEADGDQIYAVLKGSAVNHDGHSEAMTSPDAAAQADLLTRAWAGAGVDPRSVGYIEVHGTATRVGDPIEFDGLARAFGTATSDEQFCAVGTAKANIGHLFEGSGVMGLIKTALTLQRRQIPPLANFAEPNAKLDFEHSPLRVPTELEAWPAGDGPRRAGVSAFGLGGTNAHVVLEEYAAPARPEQPGEFVFTLSARTAASLRRTARAVLARLDGRVADVCWTSNVARSAQPVRIALAVDSLDALRTGLERFLGGDPVPAGKLGEAWMAGEDVDLRAQYEGLDVRIAHLAPYQFDERRAWVDFPDDWQQRLPGASAVDTTTAFSVEFVPVEAASAAGDPSVLALVDPATAARGVLEAALPGARFLALGDDFGDADVARVAEQAVADGVDHVVWALAFEDKPAGDVAEFDRRVEKNVVGLFDLTKALMSAGGRIRLSVLTRTALALGGVDPVTENAALAGFVKGAVREYPLLGLRLVDVEEQADPARLRDELLAPAGGIVALRDGQAFGELVSEVTGPVADAGREPGDYLVPGGAYLFTGGTGGIATAVAERFAQLQPDIDLYLLSRRGLPPRETWERVLDQAGDEVVRERIESIRRIEERGARVHLPLGDAADPDALRRAVEQVRERHGRVSGLVHAAGIPGENIILFRETDDVRAVLTPKLRGAFVLDQLLRQDRPDFVVHMSSVAAVFPGLGQADYAAANYYLDNLAAAAGPERRVLAVDWVAWRDTGMAVRTGANGDAAFRALPTSLAVGLLDEGLRSGRSRFLAGQVNYDSELAHQAKTYELRLEDGFAAKIDTALAAMSDRLAQAAENARRAVLAVEVELVGRPGGPDPSELEVLLAKCLAHALGLHRIDITANFRDLGIDSIGVLGMTQNLAACLGYDVDPTDLFTAPTVEEFAEHLELNYGGLVEPV